MTVEQVQQNWRQYAANHADAAERCIESGNRASNDISGFALDDRCTRFFTAASAHAALASYYLAASERPDVASFYSKSEGNKLP